MKEAGDKTASPKDAALAQAAASTGVSEVALRSYNNGSMLRRFARTQLQLWILTLDNDRLRRTQEAYERALALPVNASNPQMWLEVAEVHVGFGSLDGAIKLLSRIVMDQPTFTDLPRVMFIGAIVYRRMHRFDHAVTYIM